LFKEGVTQHDHTLPPLTQTLLERFQWEISEQMFGWPDPEECPETKGMQEWLKSLMVTFFAKGIPKLVP
jgi:hypothetical protein